MCRIFEILDWTRIESKLVMDEYDSQDQNKIKLQNSSVFSGCFHRKEEVQKKTHLKTPRQGENIGF